MKKDMPLEGLRWSRDSGSALYDTPQTAVLGRAGGGDHALSFLGRNTLFLFGYNYAINTCLHFVIPSISQTWVMAVVVVFVGSFLAYVTNKLKIRKYLV